jgi:hypothetical protein
MLSIVYRRLWPNDNVLIVPSRNVLLTGSVWRSVFRDIAARSAIKSQARRNGPADCAGDIEAGSVCRLRSDFGSGITVRKWMVAGKLSRAQKSEGSATDLPSFFFKGPGVLLAGNASVSDLAGVCRRRSQTFANLPKAVGAPPLPRRAERPTPAPSVSFASADAYRLGREYNLNRLLLRLL